MAEGASQTPWILRSLIGRQNPTRFNPASHAAHPFRQHLVMVDRSALHSACAEGLRAFAFPCSFMHAAAGAVVAAAHARSGFLALPCTRLRSGRVRYANSVDTFLSHISDPSAFVPFAAAGWLQHIIFFDDLLTATSDHRTANRRNPITFRQ